MVTSQLPVMALEIDEEGTAAQKSMQLTRQGQLANTLLDALYPGIRVATVEIPGNELDDYGRAKMEQALARFTVGGVEYRLIGASGSAKSGRYYAVSKEYERPIAERFQQRPEAAVTYFGILVSPCKVRIEEPDAKVLVVEDHSLGTNDCRGWIGARCSAASNERGPVRRGARARVRDSGTRSRGRAPRAATPAGWPAAQTPSRRGQS
jgi:hypothetical protein